MGNFAPVFTLWNRLTKGEIKEVLYKNYSVRIDSLLQPGREGDCVIMILHFGSVPSWYRWACHDYYFYNTPIICKRRVRTGRLTPYHTTSNHNHTICHTNELFVLGQCFAITWGLSELRTTVNLVAHVVEKYFIRLISIISWQTVTSYTLSITNNHSGILTNAINASCIEIALTPGLAYDIMRQVIKTQVTCENLNSTNILSIGEGRATTQISCQSNLIQCDDGSCISHDSVCDVNNQCHIRGLIMNNSSLCFPFCMPGNCLCPSNYFHCISGGCILMAFICDGKMHCPDASDEICEVKTKERKISNHEVAAMVGERYFCLGYHCSTGECIHSKYVNNLLPDCAGASADEDLFLRLRYDGERFECKEPTHFPCVGGLPVCFPLNKFCLFEPDEDGYPMWCRDGSHLGECAEINCTNSYKCPDSYCIPFHHICDGYSNCIHGEDEERCSEYVCKGLLRCSGSKVCVHPQQICDKIENCPNGEDEILCDMKPCPDGCMCLSYSMTCYSKIINVFPEPPSEFMKHLSVIQSYLPFPNFYNICNQNDLVFFNLSGNQIVHVCDSMKDHCKTFSQIYILDLSHNHIKILKSYCLKYFLSLKVIFLAYNPLGILQRYAISHPFLSYINIQSTQMRYLSGDSLAGLGKLYSLDITKTYLQYIDRYAELLLSHVSEFRFDDPRLCCIFVDNKYCDYSLKTQQTTCFTLLPHWLTPYICVCFGVVLFVLNVSAFVGNQFSNAAGHFTTIVSLVIFSDAILSLYLPVMGATDLYYNSHFPLTAMQWQRGIFCLAVDMVSTTVTMLSVFFSGFLIFLTCHNVRRIGFKISEAWQTIRNVSVMLIITTFSFNFFLSMINYHLYVRVPDSGFVCNVMGNSPVSSWTGLVSMITLCTLMLSVAIIIMISTFRLILLARKIARDVENISGMKSDSAQSRSDAMTFMMVLVLAKMAILLPYPLHQIMGQLFAGIPDTRNVYVLLAFITSECFANPVVFVFRPLLVYKKKLSNQYKTIWETKYAVNIKPCFTLFDISNTYVKMKLRHAKKHFQRTVMRLRYRKYGRHNVMTCTNDFAWYLFMTNI